LAGHFHQNFGIVVLAHLTDWLDSHHFSSPFVYVVSRIEDFKNQKIIPHIVREEALEGNFIKYLYAQDVLYAKEVYSPIENDKDKE